MEEIIIQLKGNCPYLTKLDLSNQNLDISKVKILCHLLEKNTHIVSLNLENNNINDIGALVISKMLNINKTITEINLSNNNIKDKGARTLGRIINNKSIQISLIKNFTVTGCYHNTVYHMIKLRK